MKREVAVTMYMRFVVSNHDCGRMAVNTEGLLDLDFDG